ncbi:zinc-binding alcohol dehydrogenase family protein [Variovorax sp. NFACC27]|uniref:Zinc-type alcohol dehydrogenase-like protein n=1 Tax=Variovorax gossypii TaxID=1679495 RepID=A0A431TLB6_9BURK|nr:MULTISPECIES: zinc-binding alcohol dehydrogenase family protein [Variovorax]MDP9604595.1 zinc-binding alcohol dehydrogenase family protein [Variovorax paradoxus]SEF19690.1 zinc-binding alcohol dehydrogenase family protein [Variovorax sp. NFACC28]SEF68372.1 zinc-binding alcohol dehydrogenase family protein [Variovorax sp. NFACC29]SFB75589.1 zinc-binding alcohol dehydrogenase family protein [Variovorax sp. NFACC26]SFG75330.1 zinc-binding alcohol dehydrogenase family protein [Variovorax sp. NF
MKAVGYYQPLPIDNPESLQDIELPAPVPGARDLLVRVKAVSVNPVDTKVRKNAAPEAGQAKVLGWDAVGTVEAVGSGVKNFRTGDRVYYSGSIIRPGSNAELHAVDERIAALAPKSLDDSQAAALPLTTITAYELLFDRLRVPKGGGEGQTLLVTGGAGGVGSILIQLARQLTKLRVVATASRAETRAWCLELGAHTVIDHSKPLAAELRAAGINEVDMVASLTQTDQHYAQIIESLKPQGQLAVIDDMKVLDAMPLKTKCISLHWEMMFARSRFETPDIAEQGALLAEVAALVDAGRIRTTANASFGTINAANLRKAHALIESGKAQGKVVLAGF